MDLSTLCVHGSDVAKLESGIDAIAFSTGMAEVSPHHLSDAADPRRYTGSGMGRERDQ